MGARMVNWSLISQDYHLISVNSSAHIEKNSKIAELILASGAGQVLDAGCGSGVLEGSLNELNFQGEILGIDSSTEMLRIAKESSTNPKTSFLQVQLEEPLPMETGFYDLVVSVNVLFCLRNKPLHLRELYRVTRPGGSLILVSPKPVANNSKFLKEQLKGKSLSSRVVEAVRMIRYLPSIVRLLAFEKKIVNDFSTNSGFPTSRELSELLARAGYKTERLGDIQAGLNYLFICNKEKDGMI